MQIQYDIQVVQMKKILMTLLLIGMAFAADFTAEYEHLGYGAATTEGVPMVGEILILGGIALLYIAYRGGEKHGSD